ncbi:MAG: hypothetical protein HPY76_09920 [Anaerolineae bacterium]|nr:hypothetical protein [Anaerolineae bacterium]
MRNPWIDALFDPVSIMMLVAAVLSGLLAAWWMFPIGMILWLVMVLVILRDPATRLNQSIQKQRDIAQRFLPAFKRIQRTQVNLYNTISGMDGGTKRVVKLIQREINQLVGEAYLLCRRMTPLENYRQVSESPQKLQAELQSLEVQSQNTSDALVRRELEDSARSLKARLAQQESASSLLNRFDALLAGLANELDTVLTEVMGLQAVCNGMARQHASQIIDRIQEERKQISNFENQQREEPSLPPPGTKS